MPNHAHATIVGHLGKDPEVRATQDGKEITMFSLAVATGYGDKKKTTWWSVVCFGKTGEAAARFLSKGSPAMLVGEPSLEEWTDKDNNKRQTLKLVAERLVLLSSNDNGGETAPATKPVAKPQRKISEDAPFDDEIPF
jgi:single-strand DNA-binding protein